GNTNAHNAWQINFPIQPNPGVYTLTLKPGIKDLAGNFIDQNGNHVGGESADTFTAQVNVAPAPPPPPIDLGNPNSPITGEIRPESGIITFLRLKPVKLTAKLIRQLRFLLPGVPLRVGQYFQMVQLFNISNRPIQGPVALVVDNLTPKVSLVNFNGFVPPFSPFQLGVLNNATLDSLQGETFFL